MAGAEALSRNSESGCLTAFGGVGVGVRLPELVQHAGAFCQSLVKR
jgi:hypothetical protein